MRRLIIICLALFALPAQADPAHQWTATYDGGGNYTDNAAFALSDAAGDLIIGGASYDRESASDILVRKLERGDGHEIWSRRYEAWDGSSDMAITGMAWDGSGDILVAGHVCGCGSG